MKIFDKYSKIQKDPPLTTFTNSSFPYELIERCYPKKAPKYCQIGQKPCT